DVDRRGRLVEDEDAWVGEQRARERDELSLPEGEARAALAELRLVAVLEPQDELVRADDLRSADDLVGARARPAEGDVVGDRAREEEALLRHHAELAAQGRLRDVVQVDAVDRQ